MRGSRPREGSGLDRDGEVRPGGAGSGIGSSATHVVTLLVSHWTLDRARRAIQEGETTRVGGGREKREQVSLAVRPVGHSTQAARHSSSTCSLLLQTPCACLGVASGDELWATSTSSLRSGPRPHSPPVYASVICPVSSPRGHLRDVDHSSAMEGVSLAYLSLA